MTLQAVTTDDFGSKLNAAMTAQQVSNQELARRMGLDGSQVRKWRRDAGVDPRYSTIQRIAAALGLTPSELLGSGLSREQEAILAAREIADRMSK